VPAAPVPPPPSAGEFKPLQYIASHGDLIETIGADKAAAERHWLAFGRAEAARWTASTRRATSPTTRTCGRRSVRDGEAATRHYIRFGYFEGRDDGG
jgi:hypothetical protein